MNPKRNCEKYLTEHEAKIAFLEYYNNLYMLEEKDKVDFADLKHNVDGLLREFVEWLFEKPI